MKKIIFFAALIIGAATTLHAKKIGCQFEAIRKKIDTLVKNATRTWEAIRNLDKKLIGHEKKMFKRNRTYIYQNYQNPYYTNNLTMPAGRTEDEDEDEGLIIGGDAAPAA